MRTPPGSPHSPRRGTRVEAHAGHRGRPPAARVRERSPGGRPSGAAASAAFTAAIPRREVTGEKRKLCFLLRSGERGASLSPGPGGTPRCYGGVVGCLCPPPTPTPPPPPPPLEVAVARSRSCLLRCLWDRGGLLGTASGSLVIYGRGRLIKERARRFAPSRTGARPVPLRWGKGAEGRTGSRDTECGSESAFRAFLACFAAPKERG